MARCAPSAAERADHALTRELNKHLFVSSGAVRRPEGSTDVVRAILVLATCALPCFIAGASVEQIRADFAFGDAALGISFALYWGMAAVASAPAARLVVRIGATPAIRIAAAVTAVTCTFAALVADSAAALCGVLLVAGVSIALATPAVNVILMGVIRPGRQATAFAVAQSSPALAILLAGIAVPALAEPIGWRPVYALAGALAIVAALGTRTVDRVASANPAAAPGVVRHSVRPLILVMCGVTLGYSALGGLNAFLVAAGPDAGVSAGAAALTLSIGAGISIEFRIGLGVLADRSPHDPLPLAAALLTGGAGGYALLTVHEPMAFVAGALLVLTFGWAWIALFAFSVVSRYAENIEAATGVMQTGVFAGGVLGPLAVGLIVEFASFTAAWGVLAAGALIAAASVLGASRVLPSHRPGAHLDSVTPTPL